MAKVLLDLAAPVAIITLDDAARRNALSSEMFDALDSAVAAVARHEASHVLRLRANGPAFCAGFDLEACIHDRSLLAGFIARLSSLIRSLRRLRHVVVAEVHGAALAGGCAVLSACDFVCVAPDAQLGYPVHRIGVSPAVSIPTLRLATGGSSRPLALGGEIKSGTEAHSIGLATHVAPAPGRHPVALLVDALCGELAAKGPVALATTKRWLNDLDGTDRDDAFDRTAAASAALCDTAECRQMLESYWASRRR